MHNSLCPEQLVQTMDKEGEREVQKHCKVGQSSSGNIAARATVFGCTMQGLNLWPTKPLKDTQQNITEIPPECLFHVSVKSSVVETKCFFSVA